VATLTAGKRNRKTGWHRVLRDVKASSIQHATSHLLFYAAPKHTLSLIISSKIIISAANRNMTNTQKIPNYCIDEKNLTNFTEGKQDFDRSGFRYWLICQGTSDHEIAKGRFRFSSQAATCYYQSNHSKVEAIP